MTRLKIRSFIRRTGLGGSCLGLDGLISTQQEKISDCFRSKTIFNLGTLISFSGRDKISYLQSLESWKGLIGTKSNSIDNGRLSATASPENPP